MPTANTKKSPAYDVHPGIAMIQSVMSTMKQKTGRTFEEWIAFVNKEGPETEKERRAWLKEKHGLGTNYAAWIVEGSVGKGEHDPETYLKNAEQFVENMFSGPKENLRPIFEELMKIGRKIGEDVKVCPGQTIVPLYRHHVFAQIKPTTRTRVDLGLALKDTKVPRRLIDTGGFAKKDRITHRIEISSLKDIDDEVRKWMKIAYDMDAK